jgi:antitoxin HicB
MRYTVVLEWDDEGQGWVVHVPALPGCLTQGDSVPDALANAQEAIELHVEGLRADGDPVPEEKEPVVVVQQVEIKAA